MLILQDADKILKLEILNYQFPNPQALGGELSAEALKELQMGLDYDANRLRIALSVQNEQNVWHVEFSSLMTRDAVRLGEWLETLAIGAAKDDSAAELRFFDPSLSFFCQKRDGEHVYIEVALGYNLLPDNWQYGEEHCIMFCLSADKLALAAKMWQNDLLAFPER